MAVSDPLRISLGAAAVGRVEEQVRTFLKPNTVTTGAKALAAIFERLHHTFLATGEERLQWERPIWAARLQGTTRIAVPCGYPDRDGALQVLNDPPSLSVAASHVSDGGCSGDA